jgi:hypothetical protein
LLEHAWSCRLDAVVQRQPTFSALRARLPYLALGAGTIVLGLVVHLRGHALGSDLRDITGDALWAALVAWLAGATAPNARPRHRAVAALGICFAVEFSQLYHQPALDALRRTTAGHLVLGSGFDARDLAAYAAGIVVAVLVERRVLRR